ncbi:MAG: SIMPL domain-containing protein [Patescibacteria group bacterium]|jgi:uncharacterized protein YggE|nr:SIMPL domain-containing protein [Patescibacteria group bacterium]
MANEYNPKQKLALVLVGMLLVSGIVSLALLRDWIVNRPQWQVTVSGQGKLSYQPDTAIVYLGARVDKASTAQRALNQLNDTMTKVFEAVSTVGIPEADIQTQNYSVTPQYDYIDGAQVLSGYSAAQQLVVKIKDLQNQPNLISRVIGAAAEVGANNVEGISYELSNLESLKQQARIMAIEDARNKAGDLALAAGVKLGKVVGWWDNIIQAPGSGQPYYYADGKGGAGSLGTIPTGLQEIIVEVGVTYRIK